MQYSANADESVAVDYIESGMRFHGPSVVRPRKLRALRPPNLLFATKFCLRTTEYPVILRHYINCGCQDLLIGPTFESECVCVFVCVLACETIGRKSTDCCHSWP